jgi:uncharacterized protein YjbI with pentapeptide repeats
MKKRFYQLKTRFFEFWQSASENPLFTSVSVLMILSILVIGLSLPYYLTDFDNFYPQVLAEAHGMLFDIAVIGILIFYLNAQGEKRRRIRTYIDEIDDFRLWESEESAFRTAGNIKRLNRHHIYDLNLAHCYITRTNLNYAVLRNANLNSAKLDFSMLIGANFENARLNQTKFDNANLNQANLKGAYANGASFKHAQLIKSNLEKSFLIMADFESAVLMEANLTGADLSGANLKNCNFFKADLRGASGLTAEQLREAKTLQSAKLDPSLMEQVKAEKPLLFGR